MAKTRVEIDFVRIIAILLTALTFIILCGCVAGSPSIDKLPSPKDKPPKPPDLPGFVPVLSQSYDKEGDPLRVVSEPYQSGEGMVYIKGTRITSTGGVAVYDWYKAALEENGWEIGYDVPYDDQFESAALTGLKDKILLSLRIMYEAGGGNIEISYYGTKNLEKEDGQR